MQKTALWITLCHACSRYRRCVPGDTLCSKRLEGRGPGSTGVPHDFSADLALIT
ncbi:hypothetical protein [Candidatus Thiosymbion oneisti]|uniref:hypothetical protein n=1 Tax=Candidatus Thiosymbion oneisti TaxID=589554 RepID=UPI0013FE2A0A|nr:hypothetical protein [Candidatus Thiosymbion oneisti]